MKNLTLKGLVVRVQNNWLTKEVTAETEIQLLGNAFALINKEQSEIGLGMDIMEFICDNPKLVLNN
jgi:hypothetical protein